MLVIVVFDYSSCEANPLYEVADATLVSISIPLFAFSTLILETALSSILDVTFWWEAL